MKTVMASARLIALAGILGGLIGVLVTQTMSPRWLARMTIQIGQITTPLGPRPLENQLTASERFNVPSFRLSVLAKMGLPAPNQENKHADEIFDTIRSVPAKSNDLINVQVSAYSREEAIRALNESFSLFNIEHRKMYNPTVSRKQAELERLTEKLNKAEQEYGRIAGSLKNSVRANGRAESGDVLLNSAAATLNQQIVDLTRQKSELEDSLAPLRTFPTRIFGELYAPERPLTPRKVVIVLIGIAAGLLMGAAIIILTHSLRKESAWS